MPNKALHSDKLLAALPFTGERGVKVFMSIEALIIELEKSLLTLEVRHSETELRKRIASGFREIGASGAYFGLENILERLPTEQTWSAVVQDFEFTQHSDDICQLVFRAFVKGYDRDEGVYSLRSSLWQKYGEEWKMIFHQGTKVEPFELSPYHSAAVKSPPKSASRRAWEKFGYFIINLLVPVIVHFIIIGIYSLSDPCNNNPGCMAGSPTMYFLFILTGPTLVVLLISSVIQAAISNPNYWMHLIVNLGIALMPYLLVAWLFPVI